MKRRDVLQGIAGAAGSLWLPGAFGDEDVDLAAPLTVSRLNERVAVIAGAGGNIVAVRGSGGLAAVDGGVAPRAGEVRRLVLRETGAPRIDVLFNTHWHPAHTGLNAVAGEAGAKIVAHENTRLWLGTVFQRPWDAEPFRPLPAPARPNDTFYTTGSLAFGDQPIEYGYLLQSHTDGDIYVHFPEEKVLTTGGIVSSNGWPLVDWWTGGWILGLVDGLDVLIDVASDDTTIVPGSGPTISRADLVAQREMYLAIYDRLIEMFYEARSPAEAVEAKPTAEFHPEWGDPSLFVTRAFQSIWYQLTPDG